MGKHHIQARFDEQRHLVEVSLDLISWEENKIHFQYSPALDITGYGNTHQEAKESFQIQLKEFVNYTLNKGTVYDELERLGWTVNKRKKKIVAPEDAELLADNETYRHLIKMEGINKSSTNLELSL